jgi:hypothetical protein
MTARAGPARQDRTGSNSPSGPVSIRRIRWAATGSGYDSAKTRDELSGREMTGEITHKGDKAPIQAVSGCTRAVKRSAR